MSDAATGIYGLLQVAFVGFRPIADLPEGWRQVAAVDVPVNVVG